MKRAATFYDKPWKHAVTALLSFVLAYGAASWAIDSGRLLVYFATGLLLILGIKHTVQSLQKVNAK